MLQTEFISSKRSIASNTENTERSQLYSIIIIDAISKNTLL